MNSGLKILVACAGLSGCLVSQLPPLPLASDSVNTSADAGTELPSQDVQADEADGPAECGLEDMSQECATIEQLDFAVYGCVRLKNGQVWCWGRNNLGELGRGFTTEGEVLTPGRVVGLPKVQTVHVAERFACALTVQGEVYCWGNNLYGCTGQTGVNAVPTPALVSIPAAVKQLFVGYNRSSCAVTVEDQVFCWGEQTDLPAAVGPGIQTPLSLLPLSPFVVTQMSLGRQFLCLVSGLEVQCAGFGTGGELGDGTGTHSPFQLKAVDVGDGEVAHLASGDIATCAIIKPSNPLELNSVKCWGSNAGGLQAKDSGESTLAPTIVQGVKPGAVSLSVGWRHVVVANADGTVQGWGDNWGGQLGNEGFGTNVTSPVDIPMPVAMRVVEAGGGTSCGLGEDGGVWCWGRNNHGQMGLGAVSESLRPIPERIVFPFQQ